ncbi:pyrroline-5-carboxylate reductase [Pseudalkalibacillus caeni]|uniref:Pyrroline-5-carboxylate reductase n=1 Tax=Exobacillus caeni TaxID=2574798 RepID=A0A5R9F1Z0_9BACL|nr:pyrroline-5-carboxylate reductase [Pseudalkalibacillus caeni]TLS36416.1 pyrroline-5-carboxylate reductase [Pseudalkalibacillus caeni]
MLLTETILFVGAGSMAEAIIEGLLAKEMIPAEKIHIMNRSNEERLKDLHHRFGVKIVEEKEAIVDQSTIIVLAMKPKDVEEGVEGIKPYLTRNKLFISVLAGISTGLLEELLGDHPVIRALPNTSAAVGHSATALSSGKFANYEQLMKTRVMFESIGTVVCVEEKHIDAVTGLSGSGPAYFYYMVECMEQAAAEAGLDKTIARELILQTITGAAVMLKETDESASVLREKVTSPGGTTQAGLKVLETFNYQEAIRECVLTASKRASEIGNMYLHRIKS